MFQRRIIPVLLLGKNGLVKTVNFNTPKYVGDPINAVKIFNEKEVDEIIILDIEATTNNYSPNFERIKNIVSEAFVPLGYGGGITQLDEVKKLFYVGLEKVIINSGIYTNPKIIEESVKIFGSQSIVGVLDIRKNFWGKYETFINGGKLNINQDPFERAKLMEKMGIGELFINCINLDGTMKGYDLNLLKKISENISIPVIICGGAGENLHFKQAFEKGATAAAAGSKFVFYGKHKAVLINYPSKQEIKELVAYD